MTLTRKGSSTGVKSRGPTTDDIDFELSSTQQNSVVSQDSTVDYADGDRELRRNLDATYDPSYHLLTEPVGAAFDPPITFASVDQTIATVDANGVTTRVGDGTVGIIVGTRLLKKRLDLDHTRVTGQETTTFQQFADGSLARACADGVDDRIADANAATDKLIHSGSAYQAGCWAADLDLTGISREIPRCTAITPRHVVMAEHYPKSGTVSFLQADGSVVTRSILRRQNVGPANATDSYATDLAIGLLDSDLPAGIAYYAVPPADVENYLPGVAAGVPCLCLDQEEKALVGDLYDLGTQARFKAPTDAQRLAFYEAKVVGDSGNPAFLVVDHELVLLTTWSFGGAGTGPDVQDDITTINTAIAAADTAEGIDTGYTLTVASLSSFPDYSALNLLTDSEDADGAGWSGGVTVTTNTAEAPDGTMTADTVQGTTAFSFMRQNVTYTAGETYTLSVWVKENTGNSKCQLQFWDFTTSTPLARMVFDLSTETITSTVGTTGVIDAGGGWYRIWCSGDAPVAGHTTAFLLYPGPAGNVQAEDSKYAWGMMASEGAGPPKGYQST